MGCITPYHFEIQWLVFVVQVTVEGADSPRAEEQRLDDVKKEQLIIQEEEEGDEKKDEEKAVSTDEQPPEVSINCFGHRIVNSNFVSRRPASACANFTHQ